MEISENTRTIVENNTKGVVSVARNDDINLLIPIHVGKDQIVLVGSPGMVAALGLKGAITVTQKNTHRGISSLQHNDVRLSIRVYIRNCNKPWVGSTWKIGREGEPAGSAVRKDA